MSCKQLAETLKYPARNIIWTLEEPLREFIYTLEAKIECQLQQKDEKMSENQQQAQFQVRGDGDQTPAKSGLLCPSARELKAVEILSVIAYYHKDDGSTCTHMNEFETSVETILLEYMNTMIELKQTPALCAILSTTPKARNLVYKKLSSLKGKELANFLKIVVLSFENTSVANTLLTELVETFGQAVIHNIKNVIGDDYTKFFKHKRSFAHMELLGIDDLDDISDLVAKKKEEMPQTLKDVFVKRR